MGAIVRQVFSKSGGPERAGNDQMMSVASSGSDDGRRGLPELNYRAILAISVAYAALIAALSPFDQLTGDELYFMVAARHLGWGYVDAPPMTPFLAHLSAVIAPGSVLALRLPLIIILPLCCAITAVMARELGGGSRAQLISMLAFISSPQIVLASRWLSNGPVDILLWSVIIWMLLRWARTGDSRCLFLAGIATAVALENKYLVLALWGAIVISGTVVGPRSLFRKWRLWLGAFLAGLSAIPGLLWQSAHHWYVLDIGAVAAQYEEVKASSYGNQIVALWGGRLVYIPVLLIGAGAIGTLLLVLGLRRLLQPSSPYRFVGLALVLLFIVAIAENLPIHLLNDVMPVCWGVGAVQVERGQSGSWCRWVPTWPTAVLSLGAIGLASAAPLGNVAVSKADHVVSAFHYSDWRGLARRVSMVYDDLPRSTRLSTAVIAADYPRSSALTIYGPGYGLPEAYGIMRGTWNFGTPGRGTKNVIFVDLIPRLLAEHCEHVVLRAWYLDREPAFDSSEVPIYFCADLDVRISAIWPRLWTMIEPGGPLACGWQNCMGVKSRILRSDRYRSTRVAALVRP